MEGDFVKLYVQINMWAVRICMAHFLSKSKAARQKFAGLSVTMANNPDRSTVRVALPYSCCDNIRPIWQKERPAAASVFMGGEMTYGQRTKAVVHLVVSTEQKMVCLRHFDVRHELPTDGR